MSSSPPLDFVDVSDVDRGALLAELFNRSRPVGLGILQASRGPDVMTHDEGRALVAATRAARAGDDHFAAFGMHPGRLKFDYLYGRPLKVDLTPDLVRADLYDRDNGGPGTFAQIVTDLRASSAPGGE